MSKQDINRPAPTRRRSRLPRGQRAGDDRSAARLARLQLELATTPPPPGQPVTATCPTCGRARPIAAAVFLPGENS